MNNILSMFLNNKSYIPLNRELAKIIGNDSAILLGELSYWNSIYEERDKLDTDGYFYVTGDKLLSQTNLSKYVQSKCIKFLEFLLFIQTKTQGLPARKYFKVNYDIIQQTILVCVNNKINLLDMYEQQVKYAKEQIKECQEGVVNKVELFSNFKKQVFKILETSFQNFRNKYNIQISNNIESNNIETTPISKDIKVVSSPEQAVERTELPKNFNPLDFSEEDNEQVQVMETCREPVRVRTRRNSGKSKLIETDNEQNNQQELKRSVTGKKQTNANAEPKRVSSEYKRERYLTAALAVVAQELNLFDKEKLHEISDWFESIYDKGVTSTKGVRFRKCLVQLSEYFKKYKWSELRKILSTCSQCAYSNLDWGVQKSSKSTYNKTDRTHFSRRENETDEEYSERVKSDRVTQEQREKLLKSEERV